MMNSVLRRWPLLLVAASAFGQTPPAHPAYLEDKVHEIRLRFAQSDYWEQLTANYEGPEGNTPYLDASLEWGEYKFASVGVRFKGNSSYRGAATKKKPFRIKLNEFVKGQKIGGIAAYNLSNGWNDPSFVREKAYYEMAAALGLKTPRSNFAALYINDQYWGLYILGEVVNGDFLENYFGKPDSTGNLYKANIGATFGYLGTDKARYKEVWEKQSNEDADDWADLIDLCRLLNETPAAELKAKLEPLMDIDSVLTALALDNATVNLDNYIGMAQNFQIYKRPSDGRWLWIVWDPSLAFAAFGQAGANAAQYALDYGGATGGGNFPGGGAAGRSRPLFTKLMEVPEYRQRYFQIYKQLMRTVFLADSTVARMEALRALIRPFVQADTQKLVTQAQFDAAMTGSTGGGGVPGGGGFPGGGGNPGGAGGGAPGLKTFVDARAIWANAQLEGMPISAATLTSSVTSLQFNIAEAEGGTAAPQKIIVNANGTAAPATFSASTSTLNGGTWLTPSITGGAFPGEISVSVSGSKLAAGVYAGEVTVYLGGASNPVAHIPVTLTVGSLPVPSVTSVANAASYATGAVAPNEIVTIFGTNIGPGTVTMGPNVPGLQVLFDGTAATLVYASAGQMSVVVPPAVAGKSAASVEIVYGSQKSAAVNVAVSDAAPGLFTLNASGTGQGAIINQNGTVNGPTAPAPKGSIVSFYLTGAGQATASGVAVTIGGQASTVAYAGQAPGSIQGLYQINSAIPASAASGSASVGITINGKSAQAGVTVAVQ